MVNGPGACDLYYWMKTRAGCGDIPWNFAKFLVYDNATKIKFYPPKTEPNKIRPFIEEILGN